MMAGFASQNEVWYQYTVWTWSNDRLYSRIFCWYGNQDHFSSLKFKQQIYTTAFYFYFLFFSFYSGLKKGERQIRTSCVGTWGQPAQVWPWQQLLRAFDNFVFFFGQSARRLLHRPKFQANCTQICFSFLIKSSHPILIEVKCWNIMLFWLFCLFTD